MDAKWWVSVIASLAAVACQDSRLCDPARTDCVLEHRMGGARVPAGSEDDNACLSWTLGNDTDLFVNTVTVENGGAFHHSNWFFVPESSYAQPDGEVWPCRERGFNEVAAALEGGVLYAQSTQAKNESQRFAPGVAVRVPARSRIIAWNHFLNAGDRAVDTYVDVELETVAAAAVLLAPFRLHYQDLHLPAQTRSRVAGSCDLRGPFEKSGERWEFKLHYVLPHYHQFGVGFRLRTDSGAPLYEITRAYAEPLGHGFEPALDLPALGARGLRFECEYENTLERELVYGLGDQEMCVMLGFAESNLSFLGDVTKTQDTIAATDGSLDMTGGCAVLTFPWGK